MLQQRMQEFVRNRDMSPEVALNDTLTAVMTQNHFRTRPFTSELFEEMNLETSIEFYRDRFADASDFTFVFVGNLQPDSVRSMVGKYLASLPSTYRVETWRDVGIEAPIGVITKTVRRGLEPKAQTNLRFAGRFEGDRLERLVLSTMSQVLNLRLREVLREDLGGTYGASVWSFSLRIPQSTYTVGIDFGSDPDRVDELVPAVFSEIEKLQAEGPDPEDLAKILEAMRRDREVSERENGFWRSLLVQRARFGEPLEDDETLGMLLDQISAEGIRDAAVRYLTMDDYVHVTLVPEGNGRNE
jgi:zinc protease